MHCAVERARAKDISHARAHTNTLPSHRPYTALLLAGSSARGFYCFRDRPLPVVGRAPDSHPPPYPPGREFQKTLEQERGDGRTVPDEPMTAASGHKPAEHILSTLTWSTQIRVHVRVQAGHHQHVDALYTCTLHMHVDPARSTCIGRINVLVLAYVYTLMHSTHA